MINRTMILAIAAAAFSTTMGVASIAAREATDPHGLSSPALASVPLDEGLPCLGCRTTWFSGGCGPTVCYWYLYHILDGGSCGSWSQDGEPVPAGDGLTRQPSTRAARFRFAREDDPPPEEAGNCSRCGGTSQCHDSDWQAGGCHVACGGGEMEGGETVHSEALRVLDHALRTADIRAVQRLLSDESILVYNVDRRSIQLRSICNPRLLEENIEIDDPAASRIEQYLSHERG